ncbi:hypothetical protein ACHAXM_006140 [Skeletonema potamos]
MSGFASLLSQFKETTQAAAASTTTTTSSNGGSNKRSRSSFESSQIHQPRQKQTQENYYSYPSCTPIKTIYIACPANTETGGPEALHQLCHMINSGEYYYDDDDDADTNNAKKDDAVHDEFGRLITNKNKSSKPQVVGNGKRQLKALMLYLRERSSSSSSSVEQVFGDRSPRPSKYDKYNAPMLEYNFPSQPLDYSSSSSTTPSAHGEYSSDLVIWPEVWTHLIDSLQPLESASSNTTPMKKYQSAIWWLSVNNNKGRFTSQQFTIRQDILHLVQSAYARDYVQTKLESGRPGGEQKNNNKNQQQHHVLTMTEFIPYTSSEFTFPSIPTTKETTSSSKDDGSSNNETKSNLVVYNPAKGMHWTDEIIRRACGKQAKTEWDGSVTGGGIRFCPIGKGPGGRERMTGEEVVELLKTAKVVSFCFTMLYSRMLNICSHGLASNVTFITLILPPRCSILTLGLTPAWIDYRERQPWLGASSLLIEKERQILKKTSHYHLNSNLLNSM